MSESPIAPPVVSTSDGRRSFACFPAAVLGFLVDDDDRFLLLSHPNREGWQTVAGALEANESPLGAFRREVREEVGSEVKVDPLGVAHTFLFPYAPEIPAMLSIAYVARYLGGEIVPGSDMKNSAVGWFDLSEISDPSFNLFAPEQPWLFSRAMAYAEHLAFDEGIELEPWTDRRPWHHGFAKE